MDRLKVLVVDDESRMRKLVRDSGCDDAEDGRVAGVPGDPGELQSTDHHADSPRR